MGNASVTSGTASREKADMMSAFTTQSPPSHGKDTKMSAEEFRQRGNQFHDVRRYQEAIDCYTKAIAKDASTPTYYTNRALCYLRLQRWDLACKDCNSALEADNSCLKAYYFMGVATMEKGNHDEALNLLQKAQDLAVKQRQCYGDEITYMIRLCRKRRWSRQEEKRIQQEVDLQIYLHRLIDEEKKRQVEATSADSHATTSTSAETDVARKTAEIDEFHSEKKAEVDRLLAEMDDRRRKRDLPDYLCGKISFELMRDPVITPSGITYDRKDIDEHLKRVGHFDPVTRTELTQDLLIPNLAMKEVLDHFISQNEWALDY